MLLTPDGKPREDLWVADRIHPNHEGHLLRVKIMRPILGEPDKKTGVSILEFNPTSARLAGESGTPNLLTSKTLAAYHPRRADHVYDLIY